MSKKIECRLPDELYADLKEYAGKEGVTITDIVIAGINSQMQPCVTMPALPKSPVASPGEVNKSIDTIYEPDPVKPAKAPKVSVSKQAAPIVAALLSSISKQPTVPHHPCCICAMCKSV